MIAIKIKDLKKYYSSHSGLKDKTKAVDGISFDIQNKEVFGFLGPNGAGKTTTIRCMMDFLRPTGGEINILGLDAQKDSVELKKKIGYLSGDVSLYEKQTGDDHIKLTESIDGKSKIVNDLIKRLSFDPKVKFKNLSSGNKQKLGLILALMNEPEILILDEPTVGLDPLLQNTIYEILKEFKEKGTTIFISSHNLPEVEKICDRVGIIKAGKLIAIEDIKNIKGKKIYTVRFHLDEKLNKKDFEEDGIEIIGQIDNSLTLKVKKDINEVVAKLSKYKLRDVEIIHASLEDIFLEFYK